MIIEYDKQYDENIKDLLVDLQCHIKNIDIEGYTTLTSEYRELYFQKVLKEVNDFEGKIFLYQEENQILGFIASVINNLEEETYEFKTPKRGRITELVVSNKARNNGVGTQLITAMEKYLKSVGCKDILLAVFAYNENAIKFYKKNGYHNRMITMTKHMD